MATTSEKLLDAALDVILEKGWAQASTRAVADRAGVRPGVVHYPFASQQDLRIDAAMRGLEPLRVALTDAIARRDLQSAISMATGPPMVCPCRMPPSSVTRSCSNVIRAPRPQPSRRRASAAATCSRKAQHRHTCATGPTTPPSWWA